MSNSRTWLIGLAAILGFAGAASAQFNNGAGVATASTPLVITAGNIACATCTTSAAALVSGKILTGSGLQAMASSNVTLTNPATTATLTLANNSSLITVGAFAGTLTFTAASNATIPAGTHSLAPLDDPTFSGTVSATLIGLDSGGSYFWSGRSVLQSPSDGIIRILDSTQTTFGRLQLGGGTSSFPSLKRNGANLESRLADDSLSGGFIDSGLISSGTKFTLTGCAAGTTVGGATAGTFASGTTGACTVVITMNGATGLTAPTGWHCSASDRTTPANLFDQSASSATTATLTGTTVSGDVISFMCMGY